MTTGVRLLHESFDPAEELRRFTADAEGAGAIVSFVGLARATAKGGAPIDALVLESYRTATLRSMDVIAEAANARFDIIRSFVIHRDGHILPGEPIVFVAAASAHRRAAFDAADYMMDRLKSEAVFWKRENGSGGTNWIEPTEADAADLARWDEQLGTANVQK